MPTLTAPDGTQLVYDACEPVSPRADWTKATVGTGLTTSVCVFDELQPVKVFVPVTV